MELLDKKRVQKYVVGDNETVISIAVKFNMTGGAFRKLNKLSTSDPVYPGQTVNVYAAEEKKRGNENSPSSSKIDHLHHVRFKPKSQQISTLAALRRKLDRYYVLDSDSTGNDSTFDSFGTPLQPDGLHRGFSKDILHEFKEDKVYQEGVRFVIEQTSVLGMLTVTPQRIIFEPGLDEPEVKEYGLLECQFSCTPSEVKDARILTLSPHEREKLGIGTGQGTSFVDTQFVQLTVVDTTSISTSLSTLTNSRDSSQSRDDPSYIIAYFIVNEVDIPHVNEILQTVLQDDVYQVNADQIRSKKERYGFALADLFSEESDTDSDELLPDLDGESNILKEEHIKAIVSYLPPTIQLKDWTLLFNTSVHGVSMNTFYRQTQDYFPTLIIVEDTHNAVFGAFCTESFERSTKFYGSGECFVFALEPSKEVYYWTENDDLYMYTNDHEIGIGGGGGKFALWLGENFSCGSSHPSKTFGNETLSSTPTFETLSVEVWGFY